MCGNGALKSPSLLDFDKRRKSGDPNLHSIYKIGTIPCDTQMREILDPLDPDAFRPAFKALFRQAQRSKVLEPFRFLEGCYLVSLDDTEFYRSDKVGSPSCMKRVHKKSGKTTYYQQMVSAVIVHPIDAKSSPCTRRSSETPTGRRKTTASATPPGGYSEPFARTTRTFP